jgi:hypothetical protein
MVFGEGCKLRLFEKRMLRRIFWSKWLKITGDWRKLFNVELYALSPH